MNHALISIRAEHVAHILAGEKTIELRTTNLNLSQGQSIWIYTKLPIGAVEAVAQVKKIYRLPPNDTWKKFSKQIKIPEQHFKTYTEGRSKITSIELTCIRKLENPLTLRDLKNIDPSYHPPQTALYLSSINLIRKALTEKYNFI